MRDFNSLINKEGLSENLSLFIKEAFTTYAESLVGRVVSGLNLIVVSQGMERDTT